MKKIFYIIYGWLIIRPIRFFFHRMMCNSLLRVAPNKELGRWRLPNIHWWALYRTVFRFCKWLYYDAWRPFCKWENGWRSSFPLHARAIYKIGLTTAGFPISGGQCYHCASRDGDPVVLSQTDEHFQLLDVWQEFTMDGVDHHMHGITTCPKCGFQQDYEDGSL